MVNSINLLLVKVRKWCVAQLGPIYRLDILYLLLFKINWPPALNPAACKIIWNQAENVKLLNIHI